MEQRLPNLGQELVTHTPRIHSQSNTRLNPTTIPQMPQLESPLPTPPPRYLDNQRTEKNQMRKPIHASMNTTKLDPSTIGNLMPFLAEPKFTNAKEKPLSSSYKATTPSLPQNPFIPFSKDKDDEQSSATHGAFRLKADGRSNSQERQLKAVIPSPADRTQEEPSFQDIQDMMKFSKKKLKANVSATKQPKIGLYIFSCHIM